MRERESRRQKTKPGTDSIRALILFGREEPYELLVSYRTPTMTRQHLVW